MPTTSTILCLMSAWGHPAPPSTDHRHCGGTPSTTACDTDLPRPAAAHALLRKHQDVVLQDFWGFVCVCPPPPFQPKPSSCLTQTLEIASDMQQWCYTSKWRNCQKVQGHISTQPPPPPSGTGLAPVTVLVALQ